LVGRFAVIGAVIVRLALIPIPYCACPKMGGLGN